MGGERAKTITGGRQASTGFIPGDYSLAVGMPSTKPPRGWKWSLLSDLARLETGHTPSRKYSEYWDGDVCWIGIRDATANHGRTIYDTNQHTTDLGIENSSARLLPANTVCLSRTASVGYVIVMGKDMATSQDFVNWVCSEELDYQFLKYILLSENRSFMRFARGTTHQTIYFPEVKAFHICHPPLPEQKAIAHILGTLDDKIELNRRMNATLEGMAQALFKSWFVDFDPVIDNAIKAGSPIPDELAARAEVRRQALADGTANREAAKPFPAAFQKTESMGWIPGGWEVKELRAITSKISKGTTPRKSETTEALDSATIPFLKVRDITDNGDLKDTDFDLIPRSIHEKSLKRSILSSGDVLFSIAGTIGRVTIVPLELNDSNINQAIAFIRPAGSINSMFILELLRGSFVQGRIHSRVVQAVQANISLTEIGDIPVPIPSAKIHDAWLTNTSEIYLKIATLKVLNRYLTKLRDTLLPKLISGELRIEEAERIADLETKEISS